MLSLKELSAILLIGTIAGVATIPAAFCQQTKGGNGQAQSTGGTQVLPPGGLTLAGPATQVGSAAFPVWRSTVGINICVSVVPSTATPYTLTLAPGGGSISQTGPTSTCADAQTSVTLATAGKPVTWRVDKSPN